MFQHDPVLACQCRSVAMFQRGYVAAWLCCSVTPLQRDYVAASLCCSMTLFQHVIVAAWLCSSVTMLQLGYVAAWLCSSLTMFQLVSFSQWPCLIVIVIPRWLYSSVTIFIMTVQHCTSVPPWLCSTGMPIFRYFWPDPKNTCMLIFSIFSYFIFLFLNFLSLFVFIFCETARTHSFSVIFAKVQWHPWFHCDYVPTWLCSTLYSTVTMLLCSSVIIPPWLCSSVTIKYSTVTMLLLMFQRD